MTENAADTFAGLPACDDSTCPSAVIAIIGAPHGTPYPGAGDSGAHAAPAAIRQAAAKFAAMLDNFDFDLDGPLLDGGARRAVDCGDIPGNPTDPAGNRRRITRAARRILDSGSTPILIGGDDSVPIPFFRAFEGHGPLTLVQIDAHIDWRDQINGELESPSSTMRRASEMEWIDAIIQIGIRGFGSAGRNEVEAARACGAEIITAADLRRHGPARAVERIAEGARCLITLDCDALDPSVMPAVRAPSPGGLIYAQIIDLLDGIARKAVVAGFDLVELVPARDINALSALTAARIIWHLIGRLARARDR